MKLLLDENIPKKTNTQFPGHEVLRVEQMGWKGKENGELLELLVQDGFDGFVTLDQNLRYQQNLKKYPVVIFLLKARDSKPATVQSLLDKLRQELGKGLKAQVVEIE